MNDREDEGQEEGEYHFSDDQVNYDMDTPAGGAQATALKQSSFFSKITTRHKIIMGIIIVVIVMSILAKIMVPTKPPTDFTPVAATAPKPSVTVTKQLPTAPNGQVVATKPNTTPAEGLKSPTEAAQAATISTAPLAATNQTATPGNASLAPGSTAPSVSVTDNASVDVSAGITPPANTATTVTQTTVPQVASGTGATTIVTSTSPVVVGQSGPVNQPDASQSTVPPQNVLERLATVEQQNAAIVNLLQTEYAQKMADYETESTAVRGKVNEISKRINQLEASINQLTRALQTQKPPDVVVDASSRGGVLPHIGFTVQAIIPGRAWLKSEAGETVTVAEGDILRDYGRITKIDPYDGIVNIDTGNKIVTLSYGMTE